MYLGEANYYDGLSAKRTPVDINLSNDRLCLEISSLDLEAPIFWRLSEIRSHGDRPKQGTLVLCNGQHDPRDNSLSMARLVITDDKVISYFLKTRPNLFRRETTQKDRKTLYKRLGFAIVAVALMIFVILPGLASVFAAMLPVEREVALGKATLKNLEQIYGRFDGEDVTYCSSPKGDAALEKLTAHIIGDQAIEYNLDVRVMNDEMINAFTLPGGIVILMDGLLQSSETMEATTGVLAHEIGHVVERHTVKNILYTSSMAGILSMIFGDVSGGAALTILGDQLIGSSYSRDAEAEADQYAIKSLNNASIDLNGLAEFFDLIDGMEPDFMDELSYLSSHPISNERADIVRAAAEQQTSLNPPLSAEEWTALKTICD